MKNGRWRGGGGGKSAASESNEALKSQTQTTEPLVQGESKRGGKLGKWEKRRGILGDNIA